MKEKITLTEEYVFLDLSDGETLKDGENAKLTDSVSGKEYPDLFSGIEAISQRRIVYISQKTHKLVTEIVRRLYVKNITVGAFVDSIIKQHIKVHKKELSAIYNMNNNLLEEYDHE